MVKKRTLTSIPSSSDSVAVRRTTALISNLSAAFSKRESMHAEPGSGREAG